MAGELAGLSLSLSLQFLRLEAFIETMRWRHHVLYCGGLFAL